MKEKTKKRLLWATAIIILLFLLVTAGFFIFRQQLLEKAISKVSEKMKSEYNSDFKIAEAEFNSFSGVSMRDISLVPANGDTLLRVNSLKTNINFGRLFVGDVQLGTLYINDGFVAVLENENGKNYAAFLRTANKQTATPRTKGNIARRAYKLLNTALNLIPTDMEVTNVELRVENKGRNATLNLQELRLADKLLDSKMTIVAGKFKQNWRISGKADPRNKTTDLRFFNRDSGQIRLPYIDERYNVEAAFDSIRLNVSEIEMSGGELHVDGFTSIVNLKVNNRRLASKDVVIRNARFDYRMRFGADFMAIDSSSTARLNKIEFRPHLAYDVRADTIYRMNIQIPKMPAQDFIDSLPEGLFTNFEGMVAEGSFDFDLKFEFNKNKPDALIFETDMNKENLKIVKYGEANLSKLNTSFTYRAIENGKPQRAIWVSNDNIYFTPLEQISPYLRNAVLTTEDPSFFSHKGFINDAFKQSIIKNIKTKKFARGASTISMQLVKNVFLTREKTLSRKLEEILLVYILENNRIASKHRMLEVYFNVIEWGPNIYGIGEASIFYFEKHPSQLSLNESVFLAGIVPRPKAFTWQFTNQGTLKPHVIRKNRYITNLMLRRGLIQNDTVAMNEPVILTGRARGFVVTEQDSTEVDSIIIDELDEFDF
ncbi:MAG: transglycosylase domain-containing protein [Flavobacterium sp.]|nr:transglycosylase domain-containing protein [Flavobacterium sp.]